MGVIITSVDTERSGVTVYVDWRDNIEVTRISVWRSADGGSTWTQVATPGPFDEEGNQLLSGQTLYFTDTTAPFDVPVRYEGRDPYGVSNEIIRSVRYDTAQKITNSTFDTDIAGWVADPGCTISWVSFDKQGAGSGSMYIEPDGTQTSTGARTTLASRVTSTGMRFYGEAWCNADIEWDDVQLVVDWYDQNGAYIETSFQEQGPVFVGPSYWTRIGGYYTAPHGAAGWSVRVRLGNTPDADAAIYVDQVTFLQLTNPVVGLDTYGRTVANVWGQADTGGFWGWGNPAGTVSVDGSKGVMTRTSGTGAAIQILEPSLMDVELQASFIVNEQAVGAAQRLRLVYRFFNNSNYAYFEWLNNAGSSFVAARYGAVVDGVDQFYGNEGQLESWFPPQEIRIRGRWVGGQGQMKWWRVAVEDEQEYWPAPQHGDQTENSQINLPGPVGVAHILDAGNTNPPITTLWDQFVAFDLAGEDVTVPAPDGVWLRDPANPCADLLIDMCQVPITTKAVCPPDAPGKVWWVGFTGPIEHPADAASFDVVGDPLPDTVYDVRKAPVAGLIVSTRSLADRQRLLGLLAPGRPLYFAPPPVYGFDPAYIAVGAVTEARMSRDHRVPWRRWALPFVETRQPAGPIGGECGTRWDDLCQCFTTWDDIDVANMSGVDVLEGEAVDC